MPEVPLGAARGLVRVAPAMAKGEIVITLDRIAVEGVEARPGEAENPEEVVLGGAKALRALRVPLRTLLSSIQALEPTRLLLRDSIRDQIRFAVYGEKMFVEMWEVAPGLQGQGDGRLLFQGTGGKSGSDFDSWCC